MGKKTDRLKVVVIFMLKNLLVKNKSVSVNKGSCSKRETMKSKLYISIIVTVFALSAQTGSGYSLQDCKDLAVKNNTAVTNASLEVEASNQTIKAVFTKFFPSVDANFFTFKTNDPFINLKTPSMNLPVYDGNPVNLMNPTQFAYVPEIPISALDKGTVGVIAAKQPLYAGGRIINGYKLAKVGKEVNEKKLTLAKNEVNLTTEQYYWQIVALQSKLKTLDFYGMLLDTLSKEANDAFNAGLIYRNDLLKVSIKQSELQSNRIKLENGIAIAKMAFCQYLGIPYDSLITLSDSTIEYTLPKDVFVNPDSALKTRPEYTLLQKALKAEKLQTKIKSGEYLPELGVGAGEFYFRDFGSDGANGIVFASLKVPLSAWWEASHTIHERKIRESMVEKNNKNNIELMRVQIEKAWKELSEKYEQINVAEKKLDQASENLKLNSDNYRAGLVTVSDMLDAQAMYKAAKDDHLDARINYKMITATYLQITGR